MNIKEDFKFRSPAVKKHIFLRMTAKWWRVKNVKTGQFLHMDGMTWAADKRFLYLGTTSKLEALTKISPALKSDDWVAVDVTDEVRGKDKLRPIYRRR